MKKKANIYDADDVERSKRLNFTPEERAARAEHKAEVLGTKLEKAKKKVPKKKKLRLQKELDPEKSKLKHTLRFEEVEKKRGQEALPKKAGRRMVQSASATVHSKIHQVEEENVGTKAAHRTELASEGAAALASHEIRKYRQNAPYKRVEKLEAQVNRANVSAAYRAAVRDNPELQENTVKRLIQKQRIKHQYAKEFRKAKQAEKQGSAFVQKAKDMFGSIGQTVATAVQEHKGGLVMAGAIAMLIIMVFSSLSSCSVMMDGAMSAVLGTSYTSEDPDIIQTEANYTALETALQNELANIERTHPGYDEYRYDVDSIGHNPNELISYLTAKFDAFTPAQVQAELESMFDRQYSLTTREVVEIRTRTVTSTDPETGETTEDEEEYEYYILYVTLNLEFQNLVKKWIDILIDEGMMVKTNLGVIICRRDEFEYDLYREMQECQEKERVLKLYKELKENIPATITILRNKYADVEIISKGEFKALPVVLEEISPLDKTMKDVLFSLYKMSLQITGTDSSVLEIGSRMRSNTKRYMDVLGNGGEFYYLDESSEYIDKALEIAGDVNRLKSITYLSI